MMKRIVCLMIGFTMVLTLTLPHIAGAAEKEVLGVGYPTEKIVQGKTLQLNGVGYRKAFVFVNVYTVGLYLENPSNDPREIIESEQMKQMVTQYLTTRATAEKLQSGFIEIMEKSNPPEMVERQRENIKRYASWLDKDMKPGLTSVSTYVPGRGLTLVYQGETKGTIQDKEFARMYYRSNVGPKAENSVRNGLLGLGR